MSTKAKSKLFLPQAADASRVAAVAHGDHVVPIALQAGRQGRANPGLVVDDENLESLTGLSERDMVRLRDSVITWLRSISGVFTTSFLLCNVTLARRRRFLDHLQFDQLFPKFLPARRVHRSQSMLFRPISFNASGFPARPRRRRRYPDPYRDSIFPSPRWRISGLSR